MRISLAWKWCSYQLGCKSGPPGSETMVDLQGWATETAWEDAQSSYREKISLPWNSLRYITMKKLPNNNYGTLGTSERQNHSSALPQQWLCTRYYDKNFIQLYCIPILWDGSPCHRELRKEKSLAQGSRGQYIAQMWHLSQSILYHP